MLGRIRDRLQICKSLNVKCRATSIGSYNSWFLHIFVKSIFEKAISVFSVGKLNNKFFPGEICSFGRDQ
jgi:hypothetical protein